MEELEVEYKKGRVLSGNMDLQFIPSDLLKTLEDCEEVFSDINKDLENLKEILEVSEIELPNRFSYNDLNTCNTLLKEENKCNCDEKSNTNVFFPHNLLFDVHKKLCNELNSEYHNSEELDSIIEQIKIYLTDVEGEQNAQAEELEETKAVNKSLSEDVIWKHKKIQELTHVNHCLKEQCKALSSENSSILVNSLQDDSEKVMKDLKANYTVIVNELDDVKIKLVESQKINKMKIQEIVALSEHIFILEQALNNKDSDVILLQDEINISKNKLSKMSEENVTYRQKLEFKIIQLINEKQSLEHELKTIRNDLETINNKLLEYVTNKEKLVGELQANIVKNQDLHDNLKKVGDENLDLKDKLSTSEKYINDLKLNSDHFSSLNREVGTLQDEIKTKNESLSTITKDLQDLKNENEKYKNSLKDLEIKREDLLQEATKKDQSIENLTFQSELNQLKFGNKDLNQLRLELTEKNKNLNEQLRKAELKLDDNSNEIRFLEETILKLEKQKQDLDLKCYKHEKELSEKDRKLNSITDEFYKMETSIKYYENEHLNFKEKLSASEIYINELTGCLETSQLELKQLKIEKVDLKHLRLQLHKNMQENKNLSNQLEKAESKLDDSTYKIRDLEEKIAILSNESILLNAKHTDIKTELMNFKVINKEENSEALLKSADSHKEEIEKIILEKTAIIQKMEALQETNSLLELELEDNTLKYFKLESNYEDLKSTALEENSQIKNLNLKLKEETFQLKTNISNLEEIIKSIKDENYNQTLEIQDNNKKINKINLDYEELKCREVEKNSELKTVNFKLSQLETKEHKLKNELQNWKDTYNKTNQELLENKTKLEMLNFELETTKKSLQNMITFRNQCFVKISGLNKILKENEADIEKIKNKKTIESPDKNSINSSRQILQENVKARRRSTHDGRRGLLPNNGQISCWEKANKILLSELDGLEKIANEGNLSKDIESMKQDAVIKIKSSAMHRIFDLDYVIDNLHQSISKSQCKKCLCFWKQINTLQSDISDLRSNLLSSNLGCILFESHGASVLNLLKRLVDYVSTLGDLNLKNIATKIFSQIKEVENVKVNLKSEDNNVTYFILKVLNKLEEMEKTEQIVASNKCNDLCCKIQLIFKLIRFMIRRLKRTISFIHLINSEYQNVTEDYMKMNEESFYTDDLKIEEIVYVLSDNRSLKVQKPTEENEMVTKELSNGSPQVRGLIWRI